MNKKKSSHEPRQFKSKHNSKKYRTYSNDKSGISFKYYDNWIEVKDELIKNKFNVNMYAHEHSMDFSVSRLPTKLNSFVRRWRSVTAIYCVLNSNESVVEEIHVNKYIIDNEETVSLITCSSSKKTYFEYILVSHKKQCYLLMISSSSDIRKIAIDNINDQIKIILKSFKFLN